MAEKVRYYLEQSVPELEDLEKKGLFEKHELNSIIRKRTDFENRIQSRGCKPRDFLKYIAFETHLEKLRKKRYNRYKSVGALKNTKKSVSDYAGPRRILFLFDRSVSRFPNDFKLWTEYLQFAKKNGSVKTVYKIYTRALQLHTTNVKLWISAADYEFEENFNVKGSRTLFQRALRFNGESLTLWLAYTEFELLYVTKLLERRRILGLMEAKKAEVAENEADFDSDEIKLPEKDLEQDSELQQLPEADLDMLGTPETNPALRGDVALTIYDVAMNTSKEKRFENSMKFLAVFDRFVSLNREYLCNHVISALMAQDPQNVDVVVLDVTLPIRFETHDSKTFVDNLKLAVNKYNGFKARNAQLAPELKKRFVERLDKFRGHGNEKMDALLESLVKKL